MQRAEGFSLIEMLVVLFVVVLMTSLVTLNVSSGARDRELQERLDTLMAVAGYALDEAQFSGSELGLLFVSEANERGEPRVTVYWRQRLAEGWRSPEGSVDIFEPIEFPADVQLQLLLSDLEVLAADSAAANPLSGAAPQWLMLPSGETEPGELLLRSRDNGELEWRLRWDALARFERFRANDNEVFGDLPTPG
jgi:type II secretion system protein H